MDGFEQYLDAGKIAAKAREAALARIAAGVSLLEVASFCEEEIKRLGGGLAFPVNLSINSVAAHFTPSADDAAAFQENDVVKLDVGVQVDGFIADTAVTKCLGRGAELKAAAEAALEAAGKILAPGVAVAEIGAAVEEAIVSRGFRPIYNLTGHLLGQWNLHGGLNIPNYRGMKGTVPDDCAIAIEPFATDGSGRVGDWTPSEIFLAQDGRKLRLPQERIVFSRLQETFSTLPFASRWVPPEDGQFLQRLARAGSLHNYPILREVSGGLVAQAEHTFLIADGKVVVTTR